MTDNINKIESRINKLNEIENIIDKTNEVKNIQELINEEYINIDLLLSTLDDGITINKELDIDKIIKNFNNYDITKKIKYYKYINNFLTKTENEIFSK